MASWRRSYYRHWGPVAAAAADRAAGSTRRRRTELPRLPGAELAEVVRARRRGTRCSCHLLVCPAVGAGAVFRNSPIRPSVCPMAQLPIGMLVACSLATAGRQRCADCGLVRGRTLIRRDFCHRRTAMGGEHIVSPPPVAIPCFVCSYHLIPLLKHFQRCSAA